MSRSDGKYCASGAEHGGVLGIQRYVAEAA
jgi:hypothetical protein